MVNFRFVRAEKRVVVENGGLVGWCCFLSWLNTHGAGEEAKSFGGDGLAWCWTCELDWNWHETLHTGISQRK